jgi:type 2 lantibiotic biosynthesis protein LanM
VQLSDIKPLFPEFPTTGELGDFVTRISGDLLTGAGEPPDRTGELAALAGIAAPDGSADFDSFGRGLCASHRDGLLAGFGAAPISARAAERLTGEALAWLGGRVTDTATRTLVVVLDRLRNAGALIGETSEDRFRHFCAISATPEFRHIVLGVFPELGRQLDALIGNGLRHIRTMLEATTTAVRDGMLPETAARLVSVDYGLGDTHAGGQAVCRLTFDGGLRLVYKPRPMAVEEAYGRFVTRINEAAGLRLPVLGVWCGDGRGWQEHADQAPPDPGPGYFRACGHLLGVLHLLRASDMHYENVLNHGGQPVVVDAESLFSVNRRSGDETGQPAETVALAHTVYSIGLLPTRVGNPAAPERSMDAGFLGYVPDQRGVAEQPVLAGFGQDTARIVRAVSAVDAPSHRPAGLPRGVELQQLCAGFAEVYDWALENRRELESWLRELFGDVMIRSVLAATDRYARLLRTGSHPVFQQSTALKELLFHRCGMGRLDHVTVPVVRAEIADLLQGDIPYFTLRTSATAVHHRGDPIADVLAEPPLAAAVAAIRGLSAHDRDLNVRIIRAAYTDLTGPECDVPAYTRRPGPARVRAGNVAAAGRTLIARLAEELYGFAAGSDRPFWIGASIRDTTQEHPWRVDGLADDLYAGVAGLALFLGAAGTALDDDRHRRLAARALRSRLEPLLDDPAVRRGQASGGMAGGYPGLAFAAVEVGRLTGDADLVALGRRLWDHLPEDLDAATDFLMGSAGLLAASLTLEAPAAVTDALAAHMLAGPASERIYSGFAHGTSGQRAALTRYHRATGRAAPELAVLTRTHDGLYDEAAGHWPVSNTADRSARGWCHGTPGVLLGLTERLAAGAPVADQVGPLAREVATDCLGLNLSLCHGDLGNLMILADAAPADPTGLVAERVEARHAELVLRILPRALAARAGKSVLNDGLYLGLAGIGTALLALGGENTVANPLTLRRRA